MSASPPVPIPVFPQVIDSSMLSTYKSCAQKFFKTYLQHWHGKDPSIHLHAGKAFATGIEVGRRAFYESKTPVFAPDGKVSEFVLSPQPISSDDAVALGMQALLAEYGRFYCPPDSAKSAERMAGALEYYFTNYPLDHSAPPVTFADGRRGIEYSFLHPLPINHPETLEPILISGRMDSILAFSGMVMMEDDKTTSALGATWSRNWDLRGQFIGYKWGCRTSGIHVDGMLIRGVAILKTKYDTQQAIVQIPDWQVDRWYNETCTLITRMISDFNAGIWLHNYGDSCSDFGGCAFRRVCCSQDEETWLNAEFEHRRWDPVHRMEIPL